MKTTKLIIRHIEVEGSAETINSIVKSLGDLIPTEEPQIVRVQRRRKETVQVEKPNGQ